MPDALTPTDDLDAAVQCSQNQHLACGTSPNSLWCCNCVHSARAQKGYFEEGKIMAKKSGKKLAKSKRIEKKQTLTVQKKTW